MLWGAWNWYNSCNLIWSLRNMCRVNPHVQSMANLRYPAFVLVICCYCLLILSRRLEGNKNMSSPQRSTHHCRTHPCVRQKSSPRFPNHQSVNSCLKWWSFHILMKLLPIFWRSEDTKTMRAASFLNPYEIPVAFLNYEIIAKPVAFHWISKLTLW